MLKLNVLGYILTYLSKEYKNLDQNQINIINKLCCNNIDM